MSLPLHLCVICCQPVPGLGAISSDPQRTFPGSNGSKRLNNILIVYFIAKKLLKFPEKKCLKIIETSCLKSAIGDLFRMCESCESIVNKAVDCHQKILTLKREIDVLGDSLSHIINETVEETKILQFENESDHSFQAIRGLIRLDPLGLKHDVIKVEVEQNDVFPSDVDANDDFFADDDLQYEHEAMPKLKPTMQSRPTSRRGRGRGRGRPGRRRIESDVDSDYNYKTEYVPLAKTSRRKKFIMAGNQRKLLSGKYGGIKIDRKKTHFPCKFCSTVYSTPHGFKRHLIMHEDSDRLGNVFDCPKCKHPNLSEEKLRRHLTKTHDTLKNTCTICGHVSLRRWLHDKHMLKMHNVRNWTPIQTPAILKDGSNQQEDNGDINEETAIIDRTYNCDQCESVYTTLPGYRKHMRNHRESNKLGNTFDCSTCRHPNVSLSALKKHLTRIHGQHFTEDKTVSEEVAKEEGLGLENLVVERSNNDDGATLREYHCTRCSSVYTTMPGFKKHNRAHKASDLLGNTYDCKICRHPTTSDSNLRRHVTTVHESLDGNFLSERKVIPVSEPKPNDGEEKDVTAILSETTSTGDFEEEAKTESNPMESLKENDSTEDRDDTGTIRRARRKASMIRKSLNEDAFSDDDGEGDDDWDPSSAGEASKPGSKDSSESEEEDEDDDDDDDSDFEAGSGIRKSGSSSGPKYVCKTCNVIYKSARGYRRHQEEHEASKQLNHKFDCDKCGYPASCERKLRYHKKRIHQEVFRLTCNTCGFQTLRRTHLKSHMLKHSANYQKKKIGRKPKWLGETKGEKKFACTECEASYTSSTALHRHLRDHKECDDAGGEFNCEICKFPCRNQAALHRHKVQTHEDIGVVCKLCNRSFMRQNMLRSHMNVHKRYDKFMDSAGLYQCPSCPYKGSMQGFILHKNHKHTDMHLDDPTGELRSYLCNLCGLSFTTPPLLRNHTRNKHENRFRYTCEICGKGFESRPAFNNHMRTHDKNRTRDYVCNVCGAMYSYKKTLDDHMARFHPDQLTQPCSSTGVKAEKPGHHKCKWCNEVFPFKYLLVNHLPTAHKDLYNFSCEICNKAYISASSLRLHKEISHSDGSLQFSCEYCGKTFKHKHYVICHYKFCAVKKQNNSAVVSDQTPSSSDTPMVSEPVKAETSVGLPISSTTTTGLTESVASLPPPPPPQMFIGHQMTNMYK